MKKTIIYTLIIFFHIIVNSYSNEIRILYKINNSVITSHDVFEEINYLVSLNQNLEQLSKEELFSNAQRSLIREKIKKDEIEKFYKVDYYSSDIDKYVNGLALNLKFDNISKFENYLSQNNIELKDVRKKLIIEKTWNSLIYEIYIDKVIINEKQINDKLEKIINMNAYQKSFRLSEIIFSVDNKLNFKKKI